MEQSNYETPVGEIELVVERYWLEGMSLDDARLRALEEQHSGEEKRKH
ncbi:hypothetical protein G7A66_09370 [Altererythrobacter sp. SALINAS58]|nr:hypothetical protein [Alteripontixanthobacter muriae]NTZ43291.1 hypothetical protein [Alteripontixanthobacter muriae]